MNLPSLSEMLILLSVVFVIVIVYRVIRHGGVRGALYGSQVVREVGTLELGKIAGAKTRLNVMKLENGNTVLEIAQSTALSRSIQGVPVDAANVDRLITLLEQSRNSVGIP